MQKTYVLDANVLLQAPYALESFEDNNIVLPLAVLEELDALKGADGEAGKQRPAGPPLPGGPAAPGRPGKRRDPAQWRHRAPGGQPCGRGPPPRGRSARL